MALSYDRSRAVVDLGLFDPSGSRGWSGSERDRIVITPYSATPGYLPGPLPSGEWNVLLGLHRLPPEGVTVEVDVHFEPAEPEPLPPPPPPPEPPPPRRLPAGSGRRWVAADFHAHTVHSDGAFTIDELACIAAGRGLGALAVTDHNTVSHHPHLPPAGERYGILLVPGQEVTTDQGHANCFGGIGWVDFRRPADHWLAAAEADGGLLSINHPLVGEWAWRQPLSRPPPLVEAWHWTWDGRATEPLEWWQALGGTPIGGSDFHRFGNDAPVGNPTTWVELEDDDNVLGALAAGRVAISAGPDSPVLLRNDGDLVAADAAGTRLVGPEGYSRPILEDQARVRGRPGLHRLEVEGRTVALTP